MAGQHLAPHPYAPGQFCGVWAQERSHSSRLARLRAALSQGHSTAGATRQRHGAGQVDAVRVQPVLLASMHAGPPAVVPNYTSSV